MRSCACSSGSSPVCEARRRIGHRRVEPGRIEVVAEVVVRLDVLPRLAAAVVAKPMRDGVDPAERPLGPADVAERDRVGREKLEHGDRIGARPFAERPGLVPADRTRRREPHQCKPARQPHDRLWSLAHESRAGACLRRAVSLRCRRRQSAVDLVEHLGEGGRAETRNQPAAGRETTVCANQMLAARAHGARVMNSAPVCRAGRGKALPEP